MGKSTTPISFKNACDDFVSIENLEPDTVLKSQKKPINNEVDKELWQLMHHAWQNYRDESGWAKLGEVGSYIKRLKPDFDPRNYSLGKLSDFFDYFPNRYETRSRKSAGLEFKLITKASLSR
ncbi:OST-HTH/LOTUS domain-containing protein [Pseudoalteromonas sp. T1lg88]|uniref:OST-HTH/LOTUS domain-containing protein n=1 Tax=Pseudoalteromonas sp. T1lg88 TaxID=2077104 RepID=UPI001F37FB33|nr:OST-HTH/LOTUS domain-containing protein [Pseudoalteromonas sp. T1lg88]